MKKLIVLCLAGCMSCPQLNAQGILGKIKKEVSKKDTKEEAKPASTSTGSGETNSNTGTSSSQPKTTTATPAVDESFTPVFELPETDSRRVTADAYTFPKHGDYAGKIVFSDKKLVKETMTESMFRNTFSVDEPIYGRIFLKTAVKNYAIYYGTPKKGKEEINEAGNYHIRVYVDNELQKNFITESGQNRGRYEGWDTWQTYISARGEDAKENSSSLIGVINKLPNGPHTIKLEVYGGDWTGSGKTVKPLASGEFTINKDAGKAMKWGLKWADIKENMVNPQFTKEAVTLMNEYAISQGWKETFTKAKITGKDWIIYKNNYGIITYRGLDITVYATWPDGHCTSQLFEFRQQYLSGGQYEKKLYYGATGDQAKLDCD